MAKFFEEKEVKRLLECPGCQETINEMKLMPCGRSVCDLCLDKQLHRLSNGDEIDCLACEEKHKVPENGFASNELHKAFRSIQPTEVSRSEEDKEMRPLIEEIRTIGREIKEFVSKPNDQIVYKCDEVQLEFDIAAEKAHRRIDDERTQLMAEIETYKEERQKHVNEMDRVAVLGPFNEFVNESSALVSKWTDNLDKPIVEKATIDEAIGKFKLLIID